MYWASVAKKPWVFWSESPYVAFTDQPTFRSERVRKTAIRLATLPLRRWPVQMWGVGTRAVDEYGKISKKPVRNMPYFADLSSFSSIARDELGSVRFLYAGKFVERKGTDLLVDAVRSLLRSDSPVSITFAGDGPQRHQVESLAAEFPGAVTYAGFREIHELPALFEAADVLICPSRYDGWGMVVQEAMAASMPVIASTRTGSALDLIEEGTNGWLVEPDVRSLTLAINKAIGGADIRAMGERARKTALSYDATAGAEAFEERLKELDAELSITR
jgi:glycosyltransferase involved in cell wall biosynthesis